MFVFATFCYIFNDLLFKPHKHHHATPYLLVLTRWGPPLVRYRGGGAGGGEGEGCRAGCCPFCYRSCDRSGYYNLISGNSKQDYRDISTGTLVYCNAGVAIDILTRRERWEGGEGEGEGGG